MVADTGSDFTYRLSGLSGRKSAYHEKSIWKLRGFGFREIYPVTIELDLKLRNAYLKEYFAEVRREFVEIDDL